jgi:two-component system chemotaxis response regulator CheB
MTHERRYGIVVLGASLGGLDAMRALLHGMRGGLPVPLVLAMHLGPAASRLDAIFGSASSMPVRWAEDGGAAISGAVHLCPPRSRVRVAVDGTLDVRSSDEPSSYGTVDSLFTSVADSFGPAALAVVLTGGGSDGTAGARAIHAAGGTVVVQDDTTAVAPGMPSSVIAAGVADLVLSLTEIAELLVGVVGRGEPLPTSGQGPVDS